MTTEEKAKAYDKAIEKAKSLLHTRCVEGTNASFHRKDIEDMFPQLAESEDERIRKTLMSYLRRQKEFASQKTFLGIPIEQTIAWLQKEKAKAYEEALEKARKHYEETPNNVYRAMLESLFPELADSEDERTRKEILDYIIKGSESCYDVQQYGKERFEKWIAWLEK